MGTISTKIIPIIDKTPVYHLENNINIGSEDVVFELSHILQLENPTIFINSEDAILNLSFELLNELVWRLFLFRKPDNFDANANIQLGRQIVKLVKTRLMVYKKNIMINFDRLIKVTISNKARIDLANVILDRTDSKIRNIPLIVKKYLSNLMNDCQFKLKNNIVLTGGIFSFPDVYKEFIDEFKYYDLRVIKNPINPLYLD